MSEASKKRSRRWPEVVGFRYSEMPALDRAAIEAATKRGGLLDEAGPAADWSPDTLESHINRYGRWVRYLARSNRLNPNMPPADRVTPDAVAGYLEQLRTEVEAKRLSSVTLFMLIRGLLNVMLKIAPDCDWRWLRIVAENARKVATPTRDKRLEIRPAYDLYELGKTLMDEAEIPSSGTPLKRAVRFRDGLIIAVLAARAPRRGSAVRMELNRHLVKVGDRYWMVFAQTETKQKRDAEDYLPPDLTGRIDRYLKTHRRVLLSHAKPASSDAAVWLSEKGTRLGAPAFSAQVRGRTLEASGIAITPHRFRDCLATSIAYGLPNDVYIGAPMLHHGDLSIMERHYDQSQSHVAFGEFHKNLTALRRELAHYLDDDVAMVE